MVNTILPIGNQDAGNGPSVFLAGTIDMGNSVDWQSQFIAEAKQRGEVLTIYNPRRKHWPDDPNELEYQIDWELDHIYSADYIFMYLAGGSVSPVSMLELGIISQNAFRYAGVVLVCSPEFSRRENVILTMSHYAFQPEGLEDSFIILDDFQEGVEKFFELLDDDANNHDLD